MATTVLTETDEVLAGIRIIDCDAHWTEAPDLWTSRVPASMASRVPEQRTIDGNTAWYLHDELWASLGGNTIAISGQKILGTHIVQPVEPVDPASWMTQNRLALMDRAGIHAQILYPNGIGFASNHVFAIEDPAERTMILQVYNDSLVEAQLESNERLFPQALLPIWDMELTIKEMTRLIEQGIRGFTLSDKPELLGLDELPEAYFDPMWDLFNESGAVANFHIGSGARKEELEAIRAANSLSIAEHRAVMDSQPRSTVAERSWRSFGAQRRMAVVSTQMYMSNVRIIVNLCMSNLFDRYPKLKVVSAESGIGWVPFILEAMEYQFDEMITTAEELSATKRRPIEYFRDHMYVMFWFEQVAAIKLIEDVGVNNVLVETDMPHPTCLYPGAREHFARVTAGLSPEVRRRIMQDNAAELYHINLD